MPTAKQKNKKKKNIYEFRREIEKKKWNENELKYYDAIKSIQRFFLLLYHIFKWLLQITLICKHDMNKLWNALKRNCFIKILSLKMSLISQGDIYDFKISQFLVNSVKIWIICDHETEFAKSSKKYRIGQKARNKVRTNISDEKRAISGVPYIRILDIFINWSLLIKLVFYQIEP